MKKLLFLVSLLGIFVISACDKDDYTGNLELNFVATFDGEPISTNGQMYDYQDDQKILFQKIQFFIAAIELENNDGSKTSISEVELIKLSGKDDITAPEGESVIFNKIKGGEYKSITFHVGLTEALNNQKPSELPADSPLHDGTYWQDWGSYIFTTIAGKADLDEDGIAEHNMIYHIGGNQSVRPKNFPGKVTISENATTKLSFEVDLKDMLIPDGQAFDIEEFDIIHTQKDVMEILANNMLRAFRRI